MGLSEELISVLVKAVKTDDKAKDETTVYGTIKIHNGTKYVQIDGSDLLTPISTTTGIEDGERVTVMIKNHTAIVTGNISSPAARSGDLVDTISEFEIIVASRASIEDLDVERGRIDYLEVTNGEFQEVTTEHLTAIDAKLEALNVDDLIAVNARVENLETTKLDAEVADAKYATIENLEATDTKVYNLEATYGEFASLTTDKLEAMEGIIGNLDVESLETKYANIDFSNIGSAAIETFFATSGLIENVVVGDGTITGNLVGVTIRGDVIEGNTVVADKLVIKGEDGLFYKLNTDGITTESEQTNQNSLDGSVITAKSITATKISVDDLVAFDATIGGFNITDTSIYSEVKDSEDNTTRGIYLDVDGQVNFGDAEKFIKYYRDNNGEYKLVISADTILYDLNGSPHSIADLGAIGEYVKIGTYESEPCIELGESDSDFKLVITNTRIMFMEGNGVPAYINNQSLYINKAVIEKELQQGDFVWQVRANGNLGLVWKGAIE